MIMLQPKLLWTVCLTAIVTAIVIPFAAFGDEPTAAQPADKIATQSANEKDAPTAAAQETVGQLIEQLDSPDFAKRETACSKLAAKGGDAIPALEKAAAKGDLEVSSRSLSVLGKLLKSSDRKTAQSAETSLRHLAEGDSPAAARKAKSVLDKNGNASNNNPFPSGGGFGVPMGVGPGRIIINGGVLQIGGGLAAKSISVSNINGVRRIKATDGDKTVKIEDDPTSGIKIEQTDKVNGKEVTKKYEAKDVEELKKKEPEGYKIYKEYDQQQGNGGGVQMQINGFMPIQPVLPVVPALPAIPLQPVPAPAPAPVPLPLPAPAPLPAIVPAPAAPVSGVQIDTATMRLKVIAAQLESLQRSGTLKNASPEKKAEVKKQIDELSQRLEELRNQVDK